MKILITGASGFIGSHLVAELAPHCPLLTPDHLELDLRHSQLVDDYIARDQPEIVIHLAAKTEVALSFDDYEDFQRVNYIGTVNLAEACRRYNPKLRQFIFSSTMETYGDPGIELPFTETTPQFPRAPYAVAKLACEKYLFYLKAAHDFPITILRQTNAYGRTNTDFFVMERIITQMLNGNVVNLGEKAAVRNFLFIDDLIELYTRILDFKPAIGEVFVTGPNNAISIGDLVPLCARQIGWEGTVNWYTLPPRPGEIFYLNSDPKKAENILGWKPKTSLEDGIVKTFERIEESMRRKAAA